MTPEQFWEQDCTLVVAYRKAYEIQQEVANQKLWLQGLYVYEAICDVAPVLRAFSKAKKPNPYRSEPYSFGNSKDKRKQQKKEERKDAKAKAFMEMFAIQNNKKFQQKGGGVNG